MRVEDLISASEPPSPSHRPSPARGKRARTGRREFLAHLGAAGTAAALVSLGAFERFTSRAGATHLTPSTFGGSCYKPANANGTGCCACGSAVYASMCDTDGWHKHHDLSHDQFRLRTTSCDNANAWRWARATYGGTYNWRCSDGQKRVCGPTGCSSWSNTVCPKTY